MLDAIHMTDASHMIDIRGPGRAWRAWRDAAAAFGADMPTALDPSALDGVETWEDLDVAVAGALARARRDAPAEDDFLRARITLEIGDDLLVGFGSGRTGAVLRFFGAEGALVGQLMIGVWDESYLDPDRKWTDPESCLESIRIRHDAALAAIRADSA